jgi:prostaglandin-H2 D-isomerase / glutathione transferase
MAKPTLTYFDLPASRGEECRIALHAAGVDFTDHRIAFPTWGTLKATTPFGAMPTLEIPGKPLLAHSNAILVYIGREYGMHPKDNFEAARHEALLAYAEELRHHVTPVLRIKDEAEKLAKRTELATTYLPQWGANVEKQLGTGPFVAGETLNVVDIKLYMVMRWFISGSVDHVPTTVFDRSERLTRLYQAVSTHPRVAEWLARTAK